MKMLDVRKQARKLISKWVQLSVRMCISKFANNIKLARFGIKSKKKEKKMYPKLMPSFDSNLQEEKIILNCYSFSRLCIQFIGIYFWSVFTWVCVELEQTPFKLEENWNCLEIGGGDTADKQFTNMLYIFRNYKFNFMY